MIKYTLLIINVIIILSACTTKPNKPISSLTQEEQEQYVNTLSLYLNADTNLIAKRRQFYQLLKKYINTEGKIDSIYYIKNIAHVDSVIHKAIGLVEQSNANDLLSLLEKERHNIYTSDGYHEQLHGKVLKKDLSNANPDNPFYNKKVVITGLFSIDRRELANKLKRMGADIDTSIGKKTDFVMIGKDPGPKKIEKIEQLLLEGSTIEKIYQPELLDILNKYGI